MTFQSILASQTFTELEILVLNFLNQELSGYFGEDFSDVDVNDIARGTGQTKPTVKGVIGSLVKKGVILTESTECGDWKVREFIYFKNQEDMGCE